MHGPDPEHFRRRLLQKDGVCYHTDWLDDQRRAHFWIAVVILVASVIGLLAWALR